MPQRWRGGRSPAHADHRRGVAALAGIALIPALSGPVIPSFQDRDLLVQLDRRAGHVAAGDAAHRGAHEPRAAVGPGVDEVAGHVGRAVTGDQVVDVNSSELWVRLDPDADYGDARAEVKSVVDGYPGLSHRTVTYEKQRIKEVSALDDRQGASTA